MQENPFTMWTKKAIESGKTNVTENVSSLVEGFCVELLDKLAMPEYLGIL